MAIEAPGKRYGKRLQHSKIFGHLGGHKNINADLNVTPLVDMFVILVLFLIANFSATGEILAMSKDIELPEASNTDELQLAPVVQVSKDQVIVSGTSVGRVDDLNDIGLKELFMKHRDGNTMDFVVGAEIYKHLEKVADRFDDVANEINSIVIEQV